jgi:hypothetical protein
LWRYAVQRTSRHAFRSGPDRRERVAGGGGPILYGRRVSTFTPLSRRGLLQGAALTAAVAALEGCGAQDGRDAGPADGQPVRQQRVGDSSATGSTPDVRLLHAAIADEHALLLVCLGSLRGHPTLEPVLAPLVVQQRQHVFALRAALTDPGDIPSRSPRRHRGSRADALDRVRSALVESQHRRRGDALAASSGLLARLLASVSASHAVAATQSALRP